jgi:hypothetical protein
MNRAGSIVSYSYDDVHSDCDGEFRPRDISGIGAFDCTTIEGNAPRAHAVRWDQAQAHSISKAGKI